MSSQPLKLVLIGCGKIGKRHAALIKEKAELTAVCDSIPQRADSFSTVFGTKAYYSINDLLANENESVAAVICTPNGLHATHTIQCLQAGMNVLCEKPMALSSDDCREMIKIATEAKKKLVIVKQNRFNPPVQALKRLVDDGRLGRIYSVCVNCFWNRDRAYYQDDWKGTKKLDGGILYTQFSHFIDLLAWLMGDCKSAYSKFANVAHQGIIEFEDSGSSILEFENGALGSINFTINSFRKNMEGSITIFGEKGTVKIGGEYLDQLEYQCLEGSPIENLPQGNPANQYEGYTGSMSNHHLVYDNFLDALQNDTALSASAVDGLKTVELIEKIYQSGNAL